MKRGRKPKNERKGYFYEEQEKAVVDYINSEDKETKNSIFNSVLKPAFTKMVESIIRRYNLYVPDEEFQQTFDDTMSFLLTKLSNFSPDKGTKAYSYCGTICKNYLIYKNNQYNKNIQKNLPYDELSEEIDNDEKYIEEEDQFKNIAEELIDSIKKEINSMIESDDCSLDRNEIRVGEALCELLDNWEDILIDNGSNKLNKSSVLYFLRENTLLNTKEIRDSMKKYKTLYKFIKKSLLD